MSSIIVEIKSKYGFNQEAINEILSKVLNIPIQRIKLKDKKVNKEDLYIRIL